MMMVKGKIKVGNTGINFSFITWGKNNPSLNEEIMYKTDAQYAYLKLKI